MKTKLVLFSAFVSLMILAFASCSKDDNNGENSGSYPKKATIEYKCMVASGTPTDVEVSYTNESGGTERMQNIPLPYSKKITRTVKAYDDATILFGGFGPGGVKTEVYVDGMLVGSKTATSNSEDSSFSDIVSYVWR
ncbi:hypothetical protein [Flavobacterium tistrianum]|uniref:hypothetical protein n=1 Tax=Flavobacterium tistrianum TaxID=1685414 RepID=UPI000DAB70D9|nr:hypothetical protein [Flavobacterium tistrianum]KAF2340410.1 hypothetical protein DMB71_14880 [Flavobacterium tistrianum]